MPRKIALIGCGFLGSLFAEEMFKRGFAFETEILWNFVDNDAVDERNVANQNFTTSDIEQPKAAVLAARAEKYKYGKAKASVERIIDANADDLECPDLLVDAVDNIPTRQLLWSYGMKVGCPVLHLGISQKGNGLVSWSTTDYDNFPLSPLATLTIPEAKLAAMQKGVKSLPPCELIAFRGLGLNMAAAAAKAAFIYFGTDAEQTLKFPAYEGVLTTWSGHPTGHKLEAVHEPTL